MYISGVPDDRWTTTTLHELHRVLGSDFEAVDVSFPHGSIRTPDKRRVTPKKTIGPPLHLLLLGN